ncbi:hypothetical protein ERJ75_001439200 [Trypanosoma vivax]|uniref:Uncharacterized protein n=1 Tax=Trypanosoma vivax (strain Y486) TaxID=1055687 RepID=G0U8B0_TRYVY|nr:hypothetical protein TRVL_05555 [Trypanosoma vivax]KAH8606949.1 hypothetical protein ERJ75_001439200 [Trypanosoma vivax]CCC52121.1 conserved hypothetical protein [Trypanosoma vivax Y486]
MPTITIDDLVVRLSSDLRNTFNPTFAFGPGNSEGRLALQEVEGGCLLLPYDADGNVIVVPGGRYRLVMVSERVTGQAYHEHRSQTQRLSGENAHSPGGRGSAAVSSGGNPEGRRGESISVRPRRVVLQPVAPAATGDVSADPHKHEKPRKYSTSNEKHADDSSRRRKRKHDSATDAEDVPMIHAFVNDAPSEGPSQRARGPGTSSRRAEEMSPKLSMEGESVTPPEARPSDGRQPKAQLSAEDQHQRGEGQGAMTGSYKADGHVPGEQHTSSSPRATRPTNPLHSRGSESSE